MGIDVVGKGRFLELVKTSEGWEYARRTHAQSPVGLVAVTPAAAIVLVEQYRVPVGARCIEIPAGLVGDVDAGEGWEAAARRELEEETGYTCGRVELLTEGPPSAGMSSERVKLARAWDLRKVSGGGGDAHEDITVHEVPMATVRQWLEARAGEGLLIDSKVYAALYFVLAG